VNWGLARREPRGANSVHPTEVGYDSAVDRIVVSDFPSSNHKSDENVTASGSMGRGTMAA
jgi:hypothetical protein